MLEILRKKKDITILNGEDSSVTFQLTKKTFYNNFSLLTTTLKNIINQSTKAQELFITILTNKYELIDDIIDDYNNLLDIINPLIIKDLESVVNVSKYVNTTKKTSKSIFLDEDQITKLLLLSYHMKIFSFLFNNTIFSNPDIKRKAFSILIKKLDASDIVSVIYKFIDKRLNIRPDETMWNLLKLYSKSPDIVKIDMFNFIIEVLLTIFEPGKSNPIGFIVNFIDKNIGWVMRETYDDNIVTDSSLTQEDDETVDIVFKSDFIATCSYDDTLNRLIIYVRNWMDKQKINIELFENRCLNDLYVTKFHSLFVLPIISKITNIDYQYLNYLMKDKVTMFYLQVYLYIILSESFSGEYKNLINIMLLTINKPESNKVQVKLVSDIVLKKEFNFYSIKNKHNIGIRLISEIASILSKKSKLKNILYDGIKNFNFNNSYIEDMIDLYNNIFNDNSMLIEFLSNKTHNILIGDV